MPSHLISGGFLDLNTLEQLEFKLKNNWDVETYRKKYKA